MSERPLAPYDPNPILALLYRRFFEHVQVDPAWAARVREAESRGTVVYVMRNLSFVDFLALDYLTKREHLPQIRFANDTGLFLLEPMGRGWLNAISRSIRPWDDAAELRRALEGGASAALFLKRPPTLLGGSRGLIEGDAFLRTVLDVQRAHPERPILLCPQVFIWSRNPDEAKHSALDMLFGPREWPGKVRTITQFLLNYRHVTLRAGEPLDVRAFLEADGEDAGDDARIRRMTYGLLRRLERERKSVTGPTKKPADRVREEVVRSPKLQRIIGDLSGPGEDERRIITQRALDMVTELESTLDMNAMAVMDRAFDATVARMYAGFEVDEPGLERLRELSKSGTLILLPSHKSHVDYIVLSRIFLRAKMPVPLVAAGDNLNFFPLGPVFRRSGAFFIRRKFQGDRLYAAVVDAYMRRLMKDGYPIEFFLEGGRSRTGKLLSPKLGLLSMVVDAALGTPTKRIHFCPISIGYERMVEEDAYVHEISGGEKSKEDVRGLLRTASVLTRQYGRVSVQFGEPLTLDDVACEVGAPPSSEGTPLSPSKRRAIISRLGHRVMNEINRVTAVTPGALVATALLTHERRGIGHGELLRSCNTLAALLRREGARFSPSLGDGPRLHEGAIRGACELFFRAGHLKVHREGVPLGTRDRRARPGEGVLYTVSESARLSLDQAKNTVVHFFVSRAMVATALLSGTPGPSVRTLQERVQVLSKLFKYEFIFRADAPFDRIFAETLRTQVDDGELYATPDDLDSPVEIRDRERIVTYALVVKNFVEGYRVLGRALSVLLKGPLAIKDLTKKALAVGERMHLDREIERREAVVSPILENAIPAFVDQGFLQRRDGKIALAESFATADAVRAVEAKVASFVVRSD
ncbi:MAG: hypothetical protein HOO96_09850 [Polyangiaceae bacterium]|nr:hypothetical protein [Polyangiaceae bacterium]